MEQKHKVTLRVVANADGKKIVVCEPSKRESNQLKVGSVVRFEAADQSLALEMGFGGDATLTPGQRGTFFQEFTATGAGKFDFSPNITLPDRTVIQWAPGAGGEGEVHF